MEKGDNKDLVEFLTPMAKVYCTEAGIHAAEMAMQLLGGYGYLQEYRLEQTYRDARITSIYEGANGIHERMLVTRLLHGPSSKAFQAFVEKEVENHTEESISASFELWRRANEKLQPLQNPSPYAHDFMRLTNETLLQCLYARMARSAVAHPDTNRIERVVAEAARLGVIHAIAHSRIIDERVK